METIEQVNDNFNVKKPKKKGLIIGIIIAIALVIALILAYFLILTKPQFIFSKAIDKIFAVESENYNSIKMDATINASIESKDTSIQDQLAEIEKFTLKAGVQMDIEEKQEIVNLGLEYDNNPVIDAQMYYNNEEMYAYFDGILDKYIQLDVGEDAKEEMKQIFETTSPEKMEDAQKIVKIIRDEIKTQIKEVGEFEQEKTTISVGEKEKKVTKSTLKLSQEQFYTIISNICTNLAKNEKFLKLCKDDTIGKDLEELGKEIKNAEADDINNVEISIYTKGILNKFVGVDLGIYVEEQKTTILLSFVKENENTYSYKVSGKMSTANMDLAKGKIEIEKNKDNKEEKEGKTTVTAEILNTNTLETIDTKIEIDYSAEYNKGIDKIDVSNSVNMNNLTQTDMTTIVQNLMTRPLIGDILSSLMTINN